MLQIHLVLHQLNDRNQQIGIAQPAENVLESTQILIDNPFGNTVTERSQNDDRNVFIFLLDMPSDVETVIISRARHTNHQVE